MAEASQPITPEAIDHLARLARITLRAEERERLARDLEEILGYARVLERVAIEGVAPLAPAPEDPRALRADEVAPGASREEALASAPEAAAEYFAVPAVVERP